MAFKSNQNRYVISAPDIRTCSERNINGGCLARRGEKNYKKQEQIVLERSARLNLDPGRDD